MKTLVRRSPGPNRRTALRRCALGLAMLAPGVRQAAAQDRYPSRALRIIVPWAAGTPPDVAARIVAARLPDLLKQTVVVENKPGASGTIGLGELMRAPADGYTLGALHYASTAIASLFPQFKVDLAKDLVGLGQIEWGHNVLVVSPSLGVGSVPELIDYLKRNPGSFASSGVGSPAHLSGVMFLRTTGVQATHTPTTSSARPWVMWPAGESASWCWRRRLRCRRSWVEG